MAALRCGSYAGGERRRRELAGDGCSGAPVGHLGCGLVQKDERDTCKSLEHAGWRFCAPAGLATVRGGAARRRKSWRAADGHLGRAKGGNNLRKGIRGPGWCSPCSRLEGDAAQGLSASRLSGGDVAELGVRVVQGSSGLLGFTVQRVAVL